MKTAQNVLPFRVLVFLSLFFGILMVSAFGFSGKASAIDINELDQKTYTSVLYNNSNGLPTSESNAVVQSSNGLIWVGSYSGLVRYDGNEFYRYPSSTGISSVVSLFVDSKDRIWIGTNDNGVACYEGGEFTFYGREDGLRSSSVRCIQEDEEGNILIGTTMGVAYVNPAGRLFLIDEPQVNKEYIRHLSKGDDNVIYGVTQAGAVFTVSHTRITGFYSSSVFGEHIIYSLTPDPEHEDCVFLGTNTSQVLYGTLGTTFVEKKEYSVEPFHSVNQLSYVNGKLWVCSDKGVGFFEKDFSFEMLSDIPMDDSVENMLLDYEGNIWFTSSRQGLLKIVETRFSDLSEKAKADPMVVNSTCRYGTDLYVATDKGLFVYNKLYHSKTNAAAELLKGVRIRCIQYDGSKYLWFCSYGQTGLVRYDPETDTCRCFNETDGLPSNKVRMVKFLSNGSLAVATGGGMCTLKNEKVTATYNSCNGISNLEILSIEEASDGRIFMGSDGDGIYVLDGTKISRLGIDDGLRSEVILRIKKEEGEERYWIVTSNSLAYYENDTITTIKNFPYSNNFDLFFDTNGRIWVLSSNGIYVVKRDDVLKDERIDYTLYDTKCGLPGTPTANSYSWISPDGELYISASVGVASVNINAKVESLNTIRLAVPTVTADEKTIPTVPGEPIVIPSDCKRLSIFANAFTYSLNNPYLSYYLEGFDDEPVLVKKQDMKSVTYTNLKGGTYYFHLSILNTMTGQPDGEIVITIVKEKAIYENVLFQVLIWVGMLLLLVLLVSLFFLRKTRVLLKKQEENKKLVNEMTSAFAKCIDMKDAYTNGHSFRVAKYARMIAERMGKKPEEVEQIYNIALLHDIGKISVPDQILNKPARLNDKEFAVMKTHSSKGFEILEGITIAPELALGAGFHHERIDGKGYPSGKKGDEIPEVAQIIAVADTFDAMYSTRPYRKQLPLSEVEKELKRVSGTQLNGTIVQYLLDMMEEGLFDVPPCPPDPEDIPPAPAEAT